MAIYTDATIIVLGAFNPAIFQPEWLRKHDLLPGLELEHAEQTPNALVVHSEVTSMTFKSLRLDVQRDRWTMQTERADWERDLGPIAASVFDKLPETPVSAVGLNLNQHRPIRGDVDAFLTRWARLEELGQIMGTKIQPLPCVRADWGGFRATLQLQPSIKQPGSVWIGQNYERRGIASVADLRPLLAENWLELVKRASSVVQAVLGPENWQ